MCYLNTINDDYICTGIAGVDSYDSIIRGRPKGGFAIMYHKKIAKHITHIKSTNRRVCGIILNYENNFSCMLLNLYLPCDNFINVQTTDEYINCIEYVESMFNSSNCDAFICCGDLNTSFESDNAQSRHLSDFISRNDLLLSWHHVLIILFYI